MLHEHNALNRLAERLTARGTKPSRTRAGKILQTRRDWRKVCARYLRMHVGGPWHVGGHHVARPNFGPGIAERSAAGLETYMWFDGRKVQLAVKD